MKTKKAKTETETKTETKTKKQPDEYEKRKLYTWWERQKTVERTDRGEKLLDMRLVHRGALIAPKLVRLYRKPWLALKAQIQHEADVARAAHVKRYTDEAPLVNV